MTCSMPNDLTLRLARCTVASCGCMTKTPEVRYHDESCLYRVLNEAIEVLDATRPDNATRQARFETWFADNFPLSEDAELKLLLRQTWNAALDDLAHVTQAVRIAPKAPPAFQSAIVRNEASK